MTSPVRPLPLAMDQDGKPRVWTSLSSKPMNVPGEVRLPPKKVIPVIVVPGIMGSNLRATTDLQQTGLKRGEAAWRPPNGKLDGLAEIKKWKKRNPELRQIILNPATVEVDDSGELDEDIISSLNLTQNEARSRGWGEIHWDSYGLLLSTLHRNLNSIVFSAARGGSPTPTRHWLAINQWDRALWNAPDNGAASRLTDKELLQAAGYHFPVYACGYNWLCSNETSAARLRLLIEKTISTWTQRKNKCDQVILITHSMGGLVARACAKQIPEKIAGVIHGVMPALGAPACFYRIAAGTENSSPGKNGMLDRITAEAFAKIAGATGAETTPVLATASGPLELLPNHRYPRPWLFFTERSTDMSERDLLELPGENPYHYYRNFKPWYRLIDPSLADPANLYEGRVNSAISTAVKQAERFHMTVLDAYYHPNTYAFYGNDPHEQTWGYCKWISRDVPSGVTANEVAEGLPEFHFSSSDWRMIWLKGSISIFKPLPQNTSGDGTVPHQSGEGPRGRAKQTFMTEGYGHQDSYKNESMLALTQHLIAKIVQGIP